MEPTVPVPEGTSPAQAPRRPELLVTAEGWMKTFYAAPADFGGGVPGSQPGID